MRICRSTSGLIIICVSLCLASACSGKLTRSEAQRQIQAVSSAEKDYAYVDVADYGEQYRRVPSGRQFQEYYTKGELPKLLAAGLAEVSMVQQHVPSRAFPNDFYDYYEVRFTERALPFVEAIRDCSTTRCANVVVATVSGVDILGITEPVDSGGMKMSTVQYRLSFARTPIGEVLSDPPELFQARQAVFVKFDNGWRLSR